MGESKLALRWGVLTGPDRRIGADFVAALSRPNYLPEAVCWDGVPPPSYFFRKRIPVWKPYASGVMEATSIQGDQRRRRYSRS